MKKILFLILISFILFFGDKVDAKEVHLYLFYGYTCPVCENLREFLKEFKDDEEVVIHEFEVYQNSENLVYLSKVKEMYNQNRDGVPFLVIGDKALFGYSESRKTRIRNYISKYKSEDYYDRVGVYLGLYEDIELEEEKDDEEIVQSSSNVTNQESSKGDISGKKVIGIVSIIALIVLFGYQVYMTYFRKGILKS